MRDIFLRCCLAVFFGLMNLLLPRLGYLSNHLKTIKGSETKLIGSDVAVPTCEGDGQGRLGGKDVSP